LFENFRKTFIFQLQILGKLGLYRLEGTFYFCRETPEELVIGFGGVKSEIPIQGGDIVIAFVPEVGIEVFQEYRLSEPRRSYNMHMTRR